MTWSVFHVEHRGGGGHANTRPEPPGATGQRSSILVGRRAQQERLALTWTGSTSALVVENRRMWMVALGRAQQRFGDLRRIVTQVVCEGVTVSGGCCAQEGARSIRCAGRRGTPGVRVQDRAGRRGGPADRAGRRRSSGAAVRALASAARPPLLPGVRGGDGPASPRTGPEADGGDGRWSHRSASPSSTRRGASRPSAGSRTVVRPRSVVRTPWCVRERAVRGRPSGSRSEWGRPAVPRHGGGGGPGRWPRGCAARADRIVIDHRRASTMPRPVRWAGSAWAPGADWRRWGDWQDPRQRAAGRAGRWGGVAAVCCWWCGGVVRRWVGGR
jgi:hypothetical protein